MSFHLYRSSIGGIQPYTPIPFLLQTILFFGVVANGLHNGICCSTGSGVKVYSPHDLPCSLYVFWLSVPFTAAHCCVPPCCRAAASCARRMRVCAGASSA